MEKCNFYCVEVYDAFDPDKKVVAYATENERFCDMVYHILDELGIQVDCSERTVLID